MGNVDERMMATFGGIFASFFSPTTECHVNPKGIPPGPSAIGDFSAVMAVVFPIWEGLVNTKTENVSFVELADNVIVVNQK